MEMPEITQVLDSSDLHNQSVLGLDIPQDPRQCVLGILEHTVQDKYLREAAARDLFQARLLILRHWIAREPPTSRMWLEQLGNTLRMEKCIYQHRGSSTKFSRVWGVWLSSPGMAPTDLILDRLLG